MKRIRWLVTFGAILLLMAGSYMAGMYAPWARGAAFDSLKNTEADFSLLYKVINLVKRDFYKDVKVDDKMVYGAIRGLLKSLGDDYTRFMEPKAYKDFQNETQGSFDGIGIYIGIRRDMITVIAPLEGTPADKLGLKAGDHITAIDGVSTDDMSLEEAVSRIRGKRGTPVVLSIMRKGFEKAKDFSIVRDTIHPNKTTFKMLDNKIGYIKLPMFNEESTDEVVSAYDNLKKKGMKAMILDLRSNPGGLLDVAIELANEFQAEGPIVHVEERNQKRRTYYARGIVHIRGIPIAVLVDSSSASASEILAGTLQDNKLATIIGTRTFGKGTVQQVQPLDDGSAVVITIAHYLTSKGRNINKEGTAEGGIEPDIVVKDEVDTMEELCEDYLNPTRETPPDQDIYIKKAVEFLKAKMSGKTYK